MPLSERSKNAKGKAPQKNCQKKKWRKKGGKTEARNREKIKKDNNGTIIDINPKMIKRDKKKLV